MFLQVSEDVPYFCYDVCYNAHVPDHNICFQLFGGQLIALESLPAWISWLKFLSFIRYTIEVHSI